MLRIHRCRDCGRSFSRKRNLTRHSRTHHNASVNNMEQEDHSAVQLAHPRMHLPDAQENSLLLLALHLSRGISRDDTLAVSLVFTSSALSMHRIEAVAKSIMPEPGTTDYRLCDVCSTPYRCVARDDIHNGVMK